MAKCLVYLIFGLLFTGCVSNNANAIVFENPQNSKTVSPDEKKLPGETKLSKEIFIIIGRGGCCNGHIVSIDKNGEVKYLVGTYSIPNNESEMPETYDSSLITPNSVYKPKNLKLSQEKINSLEQLISNEQDVRFKENILVSDDYMYSIYLDNEKIASGYKSRKDKFPRNLQALIDLIEEEVELYKLPGMA